MPSPSFLSHGSQHSTARHEIDLPPVALIDLTKLVKISYCAKSFMKPYAKRPDLFTVNVRRISHDPKRGTPTTGVLTATIWEQTRRAGITAAAGTRLALC